MKKVLLVTLFLCPVLAYAALPPTDGTGSSSGAKTKVCFKGDASTYNPNVSGFKTGGQQLATGGRYNPNAWEAALQLNLAKQYSCGYGSGKTCFAAVQSSDGLALVLKINDNGPLCSDPESRCSGRVIDLNEASMRYLSKGKYGNNSGILKNVSVCLLDGTQVKLGPVDEADSKAWAEKLLNAPYAQTLSTGSQGPSSPPPPSYTQPPYSSSPPPQYAQQRASSQPGQYFGNSYSQVPSNQPFPATSSTNAPSSTSGTPSGASSLGQSLLDLLKPITGGQLVTPITLSTGTTSVGSVSPEQKSTQVSVAPVTYPNGSYNPSQTFVETYLENPRPSEGTDTVALGRMLETLKMALNRILEILRLR